MGWRTLDFSWAGEDSATDAAVVAAAEAAVIAKDFVDSGVYSCLNVEFDEIVLL